MHTQSRYYAHWNCYLFGINYGNPFKIYNSYSIWILNFWKIWMFGKLQIIIMHSIGGAILYSKLQLYWKFLNRNLIFKNFMCWLVFLPFCVTLWTLFDFFYFWPRTIWRWALVYEPFAVQMQLQLCFCQWITNLVKYAMTLKFN